MGQFSQIKLSLYKYSPILSLYICNITFSQTPTFNGAYNNLYITLDLGEILTSLSPNKNKSWSKSTLNLASSSVGFSNFISINTPFLITVFISIVLG